MKTNKFMSSLLIVLVVALSLMAFAPMKVDAPTNPILELLTGFVQLVFALLLLGLATERGTQLVKEFIKLIGSKVSWLNLNSQRSFLLSAVVAFVVAYYFNIDFTKYLPLLDGFDADLMQMINALLLMFASNKLHPATDAG